MNFVESSLIELKRQIVPDIRKTIVAFANTAGGTIYIGIDPAFPSNYTYEYPQVL